MQRLFLATLVIAVFAGLAPGQDKSWTAKHVMIKKYSIKFSKSADGKDEVVVPLLGKELRVLAEQADLAGQEGWLTKTDAVLEKDAVAFFSERIQRDPKDAEALSSRGTAYYLAGRIDDAIKDYDESLRLAPLHHSYSNRAAAWSAKNDLDKAMADIDQAIELDLKNAAYYTNRGVIWYQRNF